MSEDALRQIAKDVAAIKAALLAGAVAIVSALGGSVSSASGAGSGGVATAGELDGQYGDPQIRKDPPRWNGESFAGCRFSETTPDYLDCLAEFNDWRADKDDQANAKDNKGRPKSSWGRKDARLARGWAARLRAGWKPKTNGAGAPPATNEDYGDGADDDIPF